MFVVTENTNDNWFQRQQQHGHQDQSMTDFIKTNRSTFNPISQVKLDQSPANLDLFPKYDILCTQNKENALVTPVNTSIEELDIISIRCKDTINQTTRQFLTDTRVKDMKMSPFGNNNVNLINKVSAVSSDRKGKRMAFTESIKRNMRSKCKTKEMIYRLKTRIAENSTNQMHINSNRYLEQQNNFQMVNYYLVMHAIIGLTFSLHRSSSISVNYVQHTSYF